MGGAWDHGRGAPRAVDGVREGSIRAGCTRGGACGMGEYCRRDRTLPEKMAHGTTPWGGFVVGREDAGADQGEGLRRGVKIHLDGVNRCMANLMTKDAELKTNCNTLSVTKECSRIPSDGFWIISSKSL